MLLIILELLDFGIKLGLNVTAVSVFRIIVESGIIIIS
jgi:hypothetical protein